MNGVERRILYAMRYDSPIDFFESLSEEFKLKVFAYMDEGVTIDNDLRQVLTGLETGQGVLESLPKKEGFSEEEIDVLAYGLKRIPICLGTSLELDRDPSEWPKLKESSLGLLINMPEHWLFSARMNSCRIGVRTLRDSLLYSFIILDKVDYKKPLVQTLNWDEEDFSEFSVRPGLLGNMAQNEIIKKQLAVQRDELLEGLRGDEAWKNMYV
ncbi:MAG: hypothetical protein GOU97_03920 [Nanoarchaeota archaeon]|nr:hypothetical protein [Nanoarchaeota archaeon]